ncbi:hypothetical protein MIPYR_20247 [uncultured Microbacterium sp.]|uniref:Uncharacterized protein n=1 Tax=uncultured Microbacterium sp. TaxID=191216 RepID=A0A1Y5NZJ8_9MICO|nr:hypothetical protein MIPYR_20247 [uncultured Microbacterium sp.]
MACDGHADAAPVSAWQVAADASSGFYGWRFQATDDADESFVFDVFPSAEGWHVHGMYA